MNVGNELHPKSLTHSVAIVSENYFVLVFVGGGGYRANIAGCIAKWGIAQMCLRRVGPLSSCFATRPFLAILEVSEMASAKTASAIVSVSTMWGRY